MQIHCMGVYKVARVSKQNNDIDYKDLYGKTLDEVDLDAIIGINSVKVNDESIDLTEIDDEIKSSVKEKSVTDYETKKNTERNKQKSFEKDIKDFQSGKVTSGQKGLEIMGFIAFTVIWFIAQFIMVIVKFNTEISWGIALIPTIVVAGIYLGSFVVDIVVLIRDKSKSKQGVHKK